MADLTPPPDEPIPAQRRDRIRAELLAAAEGTSSSTRRWAVPALGAAAAVVLAVGLAGWAVHLGGDGDSGAPAGGGTDPAGSVAASPTANQPSAPPTSQATTEATSEPTSQGSHNPGTQPTPPPYPPPTTISSYVSTVPPSVQPTPEANAAGSGGCTEELSQAQLLPGADLAFDFPADPGGPAVSYYVKGDRFVVCDRYFGTTTVHRALPLTPRDDVSTYAVSSSYHGGQVIRVAGGIVPAGSDLRKIVYTFPDGKQVPVEVATAPDGRRWWRMVHDYDAPGNEMREPPITVAVFTTGGEKDYTLQYGVDTCAQANHGC